MILVEETINQYGYNPYDLHPGSNKLIVVQCPSCQKTRSIRRWTYKGDHMLCNQCQNDVRRVHIAQYSAARKVFPSRAEQQRAKQKRINARIRQTPRGKIINRLRAALRDVVVRGRYRSLSLLPYSKDELVAHIQNCLEACNWVCPLCKTTSLREIYHIDHKIPLHTAKTEEDVLRLFALENLGVLCPDCNQRRKHGRMLDY